MQTARLLARFLPPPPPPQHTPPPGGEQPEPAWAARLMEFYQGVLQHGRTLPTGHVHRNSCSSIVMTVDGYYRCSHAEKLQTTLRRTYVESSRR